MASHKRDITFYYYTPIKTKINPQIFKDYSDNISKEPITDNIADLMNNVENMIVSSNAFKMQENRPTINHMKWQAYKTKKVPLTNLFMILNKISSDNIDTVINETLQYKTFTHTEIVQLADVFLGKCIMETKNVNNYMEYMKAIMRNKLWYMYDSEKNVISFRDTIIDRLENEYNRLTKIAGHIEDVFKNQIKDENITNKLEGSEDYLKKKNIILSLIKLIGSFYNVNIISTTLLIHILNNLRHQYDDNQETRKIYLELWLNLWDNVSLNLMNNCKESYNNNKDWLMKKYTELSNWRDVDEKSLEMGNETKPWDIMRLLTLIEKSLDIGLDANKQEISLNKRDDTITIFNVDTSEFIELLEDKDDTLLKKFKMTCNSELLNIIISRYLLDNCVNSGERDDNYNRSIKRITKHLISHQEMEQIVSNILNDDEIICDYPLFRKNIGKYVKLN